MGHGIGLTRQHFAQEMIRRGEVVRVTGHANWQRPPHAYYLVHEAQANIRPEVQLFHRMDAGNLSAGVIALSDTLAQLRQYTRLLSLAGLAICFCSISHFFQRHRAGKQEALHGCTTIWQSGNSACSLVSTPLSHDAQTQV